MLEVLEAYKAYWTGYADFSGRTSRSGYWYAFLVNVILSYVLNSFLPDSITYIWSLLNFLPGIAIAVRRLRSAGKNPLNVLWCLTIIGYIYVLYLLVQPDQE